MKQKPLTAEGYLQGDYRHTLFPLTTTFYLVENSAEAVKEFIYKRILSPSHPDDHFLPQQRCYAAKRGFHLRRTVKLDPIAEFFIYDVVFRNRKTFRDDNRPERRSFGYRFKGGRPQSPTEAYGAFKKAIGKARRKYKYTISLDVATYFNSIYHHDLVHTVEDLGWPPEDAASLGRFLREINSGRSIDCLPHGLHPCKALGAEFLRFVENWSSPGSVDGGRLGIQAASDLRRS